MLRALQRATPVTGHNCRAFFNFSKLPSTNSLPHSDSETQSFREQKILPYRRNELYRVVSDVESYPCFVPYCTGSRILDRKVRQDGTTMMEVELTASFLTFKGSYISIVTCKPHEFVKAVASNPILFNSLTATWHLKPASSSSPRPSPSFTLEKSTKDFSSGIFAESGPTLVTLDIAIAFGNPMHTIVSGSSFRQVSKLMVKAFEERCVTLYGTPTD